MWVWGGGCGEVGVGRWVWGGGCGEVGVGRWVWGGGCGEVGVGRWVWGGGCGEVGVGGGSGEVDVDLGVVMENPTPVQKLTHLEPSHSLKQGCGNVGSVQEVSTHTLICYIDHPCTVHSIGQI